MNGRILTVLLLMVICLLCLISAPVTSGEHPWDSDVSGDDKITIIVEGGDGTGADTTVVDTNINNSANNQDGSGTPTGQTTSRTMMFSTLQYFMSMMLSL